LGFLEAWAAATLMLALGVATQVGAPAQTDQRAADEQVAKIGDPGRYLANQRAKVAAAKAGEHGKLSASDVRRLEAAERDIERDIERLVAGRQNLNDLDPSERVAVYNAQETISGIAAGNDRTRMVCKRRQISGTRLKTTECLTKDESDARARAAQESTRNAQNPTCVPGETSSC